MYCIGGIRCEKASSLLLSQGFEEVYVSLKSGILKYLEEVPKTESFWEGKYFVFDKRAYVEHGLAQGTHKLCHGCKCKQPLVMKTWKLQSMSMEFLVFTIGYGPISPSGPER
ncbi:unnamed protein product [Brassica napus]|uniref:(rape) hypothetical protein n=1 Tax=Brassica napus TaxID=3708 RepID=A0A816IBJ4_BRANA|nr:unnamed protein product [Brassica napus]